MAPELDELKAMWLSLKAHIDRLAGERQQYLDVFERSPSAYVVTDLEGQIVEVNGAAVDVLLRRRRVLRGRPMAGFVALEHRAQFRARLRSVAEGEPAPQEAWSAVFEAPGERIGVTLGARLMGPAGRASGICWRLEPQP